MGDGSQPPGTERVVIALGGNTLLGEQGPWTIDAQRTVIEATARRVVEAIHAGYDVVLTHGNGPQVGSLMLQQEQAPETPQLPLDVLVAETQAQIGYLLQQALDNALSGETDFMTIVTQAIVEETDPAFDDPTKPIGPFYTEAEARAKPFETRAVSSGDRPYRRVVPSPDPVAIVEADEIDRLVDRGYFVICAGGGGIPVIRDDGLVGVEAVVDKDLASALLGSEIGAEVMVILTDVESVFVDYAGPNQRPLERVTTGELREHLEADEFAPGSMRPKVEACIRFVEDGGDRAVITSPDRLDQALAGTAGTRIVE